MRKWAFLWLFACTSQVCSADNNTLLEPLFTEQENTYLQNLDYLTVCNVAQAAGSNASFDLVKLLLSKTGIKLKSTERLPWSKSFSNLLDKQCDILPWATMAPERASIMGFTSPYARLKRLVVTKRGGPYIRHLSEIKDKVFAGLANSYMLKQAKKRYPNLTVKETKLPNDAFLLVAKGEAYGAFASVYSVANLFDRPELSNLKIAGILPSAYDHVASLATRKDDALLLSILEKAIVTVDKAEVDDFISRGSVTTFQPTIDYKKHWFPILMTIVFVAFLVWWNKNLRRLNGQLEKAQRALESKTEELERLSLTDALTKVSNRIKLDQVFAQEAERAARYYQPLSIILIDIDYFKDVNDTYGHVVGDQILVKFASTVMDSLRSNDVLGRWGGEEFLVICSSIGLKKVELVAEKLRSVLENTDFSPVHNLTASFGVAQWNASDTQESLISRADNALYLSKNNGRNKVSVAVG